MRPIEFTEAGDPVFRSVRAPQETTIGSRLRSERKRMGLSQTAFAELGGVSRKAQHRYEQDERAPDVRYVSRIAQAGADVLFIITGVRGLEEGVSRADVQSIPAARVSSPDREDWPMLRAYHLEIPEGYRALSVVFFPEPSGSRTGTQPDRRDPLGQGTKRFQAGVLMCRQGTGDQEAFRVFADGVWQGSVFPLSDGRCLQVPQGRSDVAVLPLAYSSRVPMDQPSLSGCLVLMPLMRFPKVASGPYLSPMLFVDGRQILATPAGCSA